MKDDAAHWGEGVCVDPGGLKGHDGYMNREDESAAGATMAERNEDTDNHRVSTTFRDVGMLATVFNNLPVAVFCKDASNDFRIILWNKKNAEITGISAEEALGKTDYDLFIKETADFFRNIDKVVLSNGKLLDVPEEKMDSPNMGKIYLHTIKVPIVDPERGLKLILGICEDITEKKKAQEQLRELGENLSEKEKQLLKLNENLSHANEELKATQLQLIQAEKMESVGRLAAGVAHEVKNPLALLLMGVEYLSDGLDHGDPHVPQVLIEMREAVDRADNIIRGLVDFSSSRQLDLKATELNSFVQNALLLVRHELTRSNIKVVKHLGSDIPKVMIDKAKMEQVLVNLFINAIHAMEGHEGGKLEVRTSAKNLKRGETSHDEGSRSGHQMRSGDRVVTIEILDTGTGIPDDKIEKIFDPFYTSKPTGIGTGLGLTVVKKIVELHNGSLEIQNRQAKGVRATLTFKACDES